MRPEDIKDYFTLRRLTANPWEIMRFRKTQRAGQTLEVRMLDHPPLLLRGERNDFHMFHRIYMRDEYRLSDLADQPLGSVVDLGANVGVFTSRIAGSAKEVIAYEPVPENFAQLERNVSGLSNVAVVQEAVAGQQGPIRLYRPAGEALTGAYSAFPEMGGHMSERFDLAQAVTLDELFRRHRLSTCDLLKLDVEGAEYDILGAASGETLARVRRIHGEYHNVRPEDPKTRIDVFSRFLQSLGFDLDLVPHPRKVNHGMFFATRCGPGGRTAA